METIGLIAGISGEVLTEKLHERGCKVALAAGKPGESGTDTADYVYIGDLSAQDRAAAFFTEHGVRHIIIGTGHIVVLRLAKALQKAGFVLSNDPDASLLAKDKTAYKQALEAKGFRTPPYVWIQPEEALPDASFIAAQVGLPCVVKSTIDRILPQKASSVEELREAVREVQTLDSPVLVEAFVDGVDTTLPVLVWGTHAETVLVSYYSKSAECRLKGFDTPPVRAQKRLSPEGEEALKRYCEKAALETGMKGLCRMDAMVTDDGTIYILEANSIMVTGVHPNQIEYGRFFLEKEGVDFASLLIDTAFKKFNVASAGLEQ